MTRSTGRIDWRQMSLVKRSDRVNTSRMLLIADARARLARHLTDEQVAELFDVPSQGGVTPLDRLREARAVWEFWPIHLLLAAAEFNASWHALTEAPHWPDADQDALVAFVEDHLRRKGRWPDVSDVRRVGGKAPTRRLPGDQPDQSALGV